MTCRSYPLALVFVGACALLVGACGGSEPPAATVDQIPWHLPTQLPAAQPPAPAPGTTPSPASAPPETASSPTASGTVGACRPRSRLPSKITRRPAYRSLCWMSGARAATP